MEYNLEEKLEDGRLRYSKLETGAIYDHSTGRIVAIDPSKNPHAITPANARQLVERKKQLARERAIEGVDAAAIAAGKIKPGNSGEGWRAICEHIAASLFASKAIRGQAEAANFLGKATGYAIPEYSEPEPPRTEGLSAETLDKLYVIAKAALASREEKQDA